MSWERLPPWTDAIFHGCLHAPVVPRTANLDMDISCVYGDSHVIKDGGIVYDAFVPLTADEVQQLEAIETGQLVDAIADARNDEQDDPPVLLRTYEEMAAQDPDHDWRYVRYEPLRGYTYQRQGPEQWILVDSNMGWA